jgi:3-hydroxybutyrate dehydrogenase
MLIGKTALITGSTSGIGHAIAIALAKQNANIIINGMGDKKVIDEIVLEIGSMTKGRAVYMNADMSKPKEINDMMSLAAKMFGGVDILVNNAGIQVVNPIDDYPEDKWEAIVAINLSASFYTTKAVFPYMKGKKWGRIINMASAHGLVASPFKCAYVAAKHGLVGLTKVAALEGATFGITCNAICPGYTHTPLVALARGIPESEVLDKVMLVEQPTKKFTTVEQLADLAVFLCSPSADNMTGTALPVDGGWLAH